MDLLRGNDDRHHTSLPLRFDDFEDLVGGDVLEGLGCAAGPVDYDAFDRGCAPKTEFEVEAVHGEVA